MRAFVVGLVVVVILAAIAATYYFGREAPQIPPPAPSPAAPPAPPPAAPSGPRFPVTTAPAETPLPSVKESDPVVAEAIATLVGSDAFRRFFQADEIVRRIVATVDNLPRKQYAQRLSPANPIAGTFATTGQGDALAIAPENSARYTPLVAVVDALDATQVVAVYKRLYPLFQQAYVDLGYPGGYFNDRLIEAIDNALAAPDVQGPIHLVVPKVLYEYADPQLQALSSGQKVMVRMGSANARKVKAKLREIRKVLTASGP